MRFDTVIIGGGLAGLTAGISLREAGRSTAIVSTGQNALHFFSGCFESLQEPPQRMLDLFAGAGVPLHFEEGVRLMPLGTFRPAALALEDIDLLPAPHFADKVLVVGIAGFQDFFPGFLCDGLTKAGMQCRSVQLELPELEKLRVSPSEMRSVQVARTLDRIWGKVLRETKRLLRDEDAVVLDNMGQTYYRLLGDKEKAKEYFDKAHSIKEGQIDTLYFLAQYDKEAGNKQAAIEKLEKALEGRFSPLNYATKEKVQAEIDALKQ